MNSSVKSSTYKIGGVSELSSERECKKRAKEFVNRWSGKYLERSEYQNFWNDLLSTVFKQDLYQNERYIRYQYDATHGRAIDAWIPSTKVLIEHKSSGVDLFAKEIQSDGKKLTPYEQAERYWRELSVDNHPKWVICCNFESFLIYNMRKNSPKDSPEQIFLKDFEKEYYRLSFITDSTVVYVDKQEEASIRAGDVVRDLYFAFLDQDNTISKDKDKQESLNRLIVRIIFCLYAEDAGLFTKKGQFHDYLKRFSSDQIRNALFRLFVILDTKVEERSKNEEKYLMDFPYVNGGLFRERMDDIPRITDRIKTLLLEKASEKFDWSGISPTIFGSIFESILNPISRRSEGRHYTTPENIKKVIEPLFLNELKKELEEIKNLKQRNTIERRVNEYQKKLASLTFLDPAAGSGNFLTETYIELRKLENELLEFAVALQINLTNPIRVSISQFYGIEINDFAVSIARTALWIAEAQMQKKTEDILDKDLEYFPLKSCTNIQEGNALRMNWEDIITKDKLNYIIGNPPYAGYSKQTEDQKKDVLSTYVKENGDKYNHAGKIDYVSGWCFKASQLMQNTNIKTAFVVTNSITQGEQVTTVWKPLYERFGIHIDFAYQSFRWENDSNTNVGVYCVIIGFSCVVNKRKKKLYSSDGTLQFVDNINAYLMNYENVFVESRNKPICNVPKMITGNRPAGKSLIIESKEYENFIKKEPRAKKFIKKLIGSDEFLTNKSRYCLWLVGVGPDELKSMPEVFKRVEASRNERLNGAEDRRRLANTASLFREQINPERFLVVPCTSTENNRKYIPIGYFDKSTIPTNALVLIPECSKYHFGILESKVHMAWTKTVCGRLGIGCRYSVRICYNTFPWPNPTIIQTQKIKKTAQGILDARAEFPDCTLEVLYDETIMPKELRKVHEENDKAVMEAYGFNPKMSEYEIVTELFKLYQKYTNPDPTFDSVA